MPTFAKAIGSMIERASYSEALFEEKERAVVTLDSIGDAVVSTDVSGQLTYLNAIAERMTGWPLEEALVILLRMCAASSTPRHVKLRRIPCCSRFGMISP